MAFGLPVIGGNVSLYNESAGRRHRPDPGHRRARPRRRARPTARRAAAGRTVRRSSCSAPAGPRRGRPIRWPAAGGRSSARPPDRRRCAALDAAAHAAAVELVARARRRDVVAPGPASSAASTTSRAAGSASPWPRWPRHAGIGLPGRGDRRPRGAVQRGCPPAFLVASARPRATVLGAGARRRRRTAAVLGTAGGGELVVDGLLAARRGRAAPAAFGTAPSRRAPRRDRRDGRPQSGRRAARRSSTHRRDAAGRPARARRDRPGLTSRGSRTRRSPRARGAGGQLGQRVALVGVVAGVVASSPAKPGLGQLADRAGQGRALEPEGERVGQHGRRRPSARPPR